MSISLTHPNARRERFAAEAREEARAQPQVYELETGQLVLLEYTPAVARAPSARVENAGNKAQHAEELLRDVLAGSKELVAADAEYGQPRKGGKPRRFPRFVDYIGECVRMAEDPATLDALRRRLSKLSTLGDGGPSQAQSAETKAINVLLATTGSDHANELRGLARDLDAINHHQPSTRSTYMTDHLTATVALPHSQGGFIVTGPTVAEQMAVASLTARVAVAQALADQDVLAPAARAAAVREGEDANEAREVALRDLINREGPAVVERMMMLQAAALARAAARAIECRYDDEAPVMG